MTYVAILLGIVAGLLSAYLLNRPSHHKLDVFILLLLIWIPSATVRLELTNTEDFIAYLVVAISVCVVKLGLKDTSWKS